MQSRTPGITMDPNIQTPQADPTPGIDQNEVDLIDSYKNKPLKEWTDILNYQPINNNTELNAVRSAAIYENEVKVANDARFMAACTLLNIDPKIPLNKDVLNKAYRRLSLEMHPDKLNTPFASARYQLINNARDVYGDLVKKNYDPNASAIVIPSRYSAPQYDNHYGPTEEFANQRSQQWGKPKATKPAAASSTPAANDPRQQVIKLLDQEQKRLMDTYRFTYAGNGIVQMALDKNDVPYKATNATDIAIDRVREIKIVTDRLQDSLKHHPAQNDPNMNKSIIVEMLTNLKSKMKSTGHMGNMFVTGRNNITKAIQCVSEPKAKVNVVESIKNTFRR